MHRQPLVIFEKMTKLLSFLLKKVHQISAKLNAFQQNMPRKLPQNWPFFTGHFSAKCAQNRLFSCKFDNEKPTKFDFFCNLSEALLSAKNYLESIRSGSPVTSQQKLSSWICKFTCDYIYWPLQTSTDRLIDCKFLSYLRT